MGRRQRRRQAGTPTTASTTDYTDAEGNILSVRDSVSAGTRAKLQELERSAAASVEDTWQRQGELLFERLVAGWTIAGLPLEGQRDLLGRYRLADGKTRRWVRETLERHAREHGILDS